MFKNKYRIVKDSYAGFEVQIRRWWFPFWVECADGIYSTNTFSTIDRARAFALSHAKLHVVEYL